MFSVTKNGEPLEKEKYTWDEKTQISLKSFLIKARWKGENTL